MTAQAAAERALAAFRPLSPADVAPALADGLRSLRAARDMCARLSLDSAVKAEIAFRLQQKAEDFEDAIVRAVNVTVDPLADRETVEAGGALTVSVRTFFPSGAPVNVVGARLRTPRGWGVEPWTRPAPPAGNGLRAAEVPRHAADFRVTASAGATPTEPYWLTQPRQGAMFVWPAGSPKGEPFDAPLLDADVDLQVTGVPLTVTRPVEFRFADPARGEVRRRIDVVPAVSVAVDDPLIIASRSTQRNRRDVVVRVENLAGAASVGLLALHAPDGWTVSPADVPFSLDAAGERLAAHFVLTIPASMPPGEYRVQAVATVGGKPYVNAMRAVAYPHIRTHRLYTAAVTHVRVMDLAVPAVRVGYIMGTGDDVAAAIRLMRLPVTLLDSNALTSGDLSRFDTIVVGIRASETRPDFVANHKRLLRWVETGGALIVQYQAAGLRRSAAPAVPGARAAGRRAASPTRARRSRLLTAGFSRLHDAEPDRRWTTGPRGSRSGR